MMTTSRIMALILISVLLQGCTAAIITGVAAGAAIAIDRRSIGTMYDDEEYELNAAGNIIADRILYKTSHINVTSYDHIVLLTGEAPSAELKKRAERIAQETGPTKKIHNEILIAAPSALSSRASDTLITAHIKTALSASKSTNPIDATRIKVVTENGVVYLMGIVTPEEASDAVEVVRNIGGVQRVIRVFENPVPSE